MTGGHGSNRDDGASAFLFDKMEPERQFLVRSLPPRDARIPLFAELKPPPVG